ncbi:TerD family protein [Leekyejoonella antrihumi]|nr:TerD family protein [Leekyejoonella antrihumi]
MGLFSKKTQPPARQPSVLPAPQGPSTPPTPGRINLTKGGSVNLTKTATLTATCSWPTATDYDVFALVEYADGHVETVSMFGTNKNKHFNQQTEDSAIRHLGDVQRGDGSMGTETIEIRLNDQITHVVPVVYSAQSNGSGSFRQYGVTMAIDNGAGEQVIISGTEASRDKHVYSCVPGVIRNGAQVTIEALELYSKRGSEKRPVVSAGRVTMDHGPRNAYK